jgi:hypothetical protein
MGMYSNPALRHSKQLTPSGPVTPRLRRTTINHAKFVVTFIQ